jgi:uracil-DNA glycosylase
VDFADALDAFLDDAANAGWRDLPFFMQRDASGVSAAERITALLDEKASAGTTVLPMPADLFAALSLTPLHSVKAVILGQDPYPTPGHAHGLAFSYRGHGVLPASLRRIFRELSDDLGVPAPARGDLTRWAQQGVLLLNTALSVEAGKAGAHLRLSWQALADEVVGAVSAQRPAVAFILWGDKARSRAPLIDTRHARIESAHPSPLAARGDFLGSRPFSRANAYLTAQGLDVIDWRLG